VVTSLEALDAAYGDLSNVIGSLDEAASWRSTRCTGWVVRDLVFHLLGDAQRGLVALATPADRPADRDAISYWIDAPGAPRTLNPAVSGFSGAWPAKPACTP
jgi:hypothetical protein